MSIEYTKGSREASNVEADWEMFLVVAVVVLGFPDRTTTGPPPDITTPSHQALNSSSRGVQRRADIEVEDGLAVRLGISGVVVDHVADLLGTRGRLTLDEPVVAIEGWRSTESKTS